ncbi:MAG: NUDIX hydrolase [Anaerolineae bacterium]|nr:NUDIX hydrolase [Anaerolineae bacterium]
MARPWQVLARRVLLDRAPWITVWEERVQLPNGVVIDDYFGLALRSWVAVFAVTDDARVPLVYQYRHGVGAAILELPAGYVEDGEAPVAAAQRELREEVGCVARSFRKLGSFHMMPERSQMTMHLVLARGARLVGGQQLEATEDIAVRWLSLDEVYEAWRAGQIPSAPHAAAVALGLDAMKAHR